MDVLFSELSILIFSRHLKAVVKSFDPGQRGWMSAGQVRRAFITLGLTPEDDLEDRIPCDIVLEKLKRTQELELFSLLSAGTETVTENSENSSKSDSDL